MTHVDERQARKVAEEAREQTWSQPSFGKQLFLGDLQLGLIHPYPQPTEEARKRGEEFCAKMMEFAEQQGYGRTEIIRIITDLPQDA